MKGRVAFVTGASQGIGRECALSLARAGARVVVGARSAEKLSELVSDIQSAGGEALAVALDVTSAESVKNAFAEAEKAFGPVEILVNNAGITKDGLSMRMSPEAWSEVLDTNLTGAFRCIQAVMRGMMKQRWGRIINISSVVGLSGNPGQANYVSSKAGLIGLTKSLSQELGSRNITVNAVAPGFIETAMTQALTEDARAAITSKIPLGKIGAPSDIAHAVCFLAADEAGYITGHTLSVNGGMYA
ncbi:MAG: 3-oxoacyl-[acyl-carrier-protein] reductase [Acidobacteria bacterium]|nr:3-oxoacyl-[acyl-carrier-protein] reductase [Acidobacteriota bacterium]MDA1233265.1 3-oxoacyl-[acyl-carrier-protein] reductase [Acidobacteriota bacterium]